MRFIPLSRVTSGGQILKSSQIRSRLFYSKATTIKENGSGPF